MLWCQQQQHFYNEAVQKANVRWWLRTVQSFHCSCMVFLMLLHFTFIDSGSAGIHSHTDCIHLRSLSLGCAPWSLFNSTADSAWASASDFAIPQSSKKFWTEPFEQTSWSLKLKMGPRARLKPIYFEAFSARARGPICGLFKRSCSKFLRNLFQLASIIFTILVCFFKQ